MNKNKRIPKNINKGNDGALQLDHTIVFSKNLKAYKSDKRFIFNQGGTRSGKTYAIMQLLVYFAYTEPGIEITVVRKTLPSLKGTALKDFYDIMNTAGLYDENNHNKTDNIYFFVNGSSIEFIGIDKGQKVRGRKRDILFCNEANELTSDDFLQLNLRTNKKVFIDFNPSDDDDDHWIYKYQKEDRAITIKSTYKDNNYLKPELITEIEDLINVDQFYYNVYVLGERPISTTRIYTHFKQYEVLPVPEDNTTDTVYGLDFGFNHPVALVETTFIDGKAYVRELIYKSGLTIADVIMLMDDLGVVKHRKIYCDSARPDLIEELKRNGYTRAQGSDKSVRSGIDKVKSMSINIHNLSVNIWKEFKGYSWKVDRNGNILDEPVKLKDDAMDALRYSIHSHIKAKFNPFYANIFH